MNLLSLVVFVSMNCALLTNGDAESNDLWPQQKQLTSLIKDSIASARSKSFADMDQINNDNENSCEMKINTDLMMSKKRETSVAYAGNGFNYAIG